MSERTVRHHTAGINPPENGNVAIPTGGLAGAAAETGETRRLVVSFFDGLGDTRPQEIECSWDDFVTAVIGQHEVVESKEAVPLFAPARFKGARCADNVVDVHMLCLDLDDLPDVDLAWLIEWIARNGYEALLTTTHGHGPVYREHMRWRARLILPLARPVTREEWPEFWLRVDTAIGGRCDTKCRNPDRMYYVPSCPSARRDRRRSRHDVSVDPRGAGRCSPGH